MQRKDYFLGVRDSLPVGIGYFAVSFGFGVAAVNTVSVVQATIMSLTNLTSAGQFAAIGVIAAASSLWIMLLSQLVINSRYALMSLALSQRMGNRIGFLPRLVIAFFNTDEIFALAMAEKQPMTVSFLLGLGLTPILGWTAGTLCGALAGSVLPLSIRTALGVMLYGMFIAIVVPPARQEKPVFITALLALSLSCAFRWIPALNGISAGISIVICTVAAAAICAWLFPVADEEVAA
jgi:predicted branched-subunit amino acid permease